MKTIETTLLRGRIKFLQPEKGFHASMDSVFLAAAVNTSVKGAKLLDMGCGVGTVGLCVTSRLSDIELTGIDIQPELIELANKNAALNNIKANFICSNIKEEKIIENNYFNEIVMNPPYMESGTHTPSPDKIKATSHGEGVSDTSLEEWIKYSHQKLKQGGTLSIIHRADRLDDIIPHLTKRRWFGSIVIYPMHSYAGDDAKRIIVKARKERYDRLVIKSGIVIHNTDGKYTDEAEEILSDAKGIEF